MQRDLLEINAGHSLPWMSCHAERRNTLSAKAVWWRGVLDDRRVVGR